MYEDCKRTVLARGGLILLASWKRMYFFIYPHVFCPNLCWLLTGVSLYGPGSALRARYLDQVILLLTATKSYTCKY